MHGGKATGASKENRNAWKHGNYSEHTKLWHALMRNLTSV
jgi:hypothetical protein